VQPIDDTDVAGIAPATSEPTVVEEAQAVATQIGDVASDTARLMELQIRLFEAECLQSARALVQPIAMFAATWMLAVASMAVLLLAIGTGLHELTGWPLSLMLLLATAIGVGLCVLVARSAIAMLNTPRISFAKSKEELMRNISVLSRALKI